MEALRPPASRTKALRNPNGLIGEALCVAYLDAWAQEGDAVLKLPKGIQLMGTDTNSDDMARSNSERAGGTHRSSESRNSKATASGAIGEDLVAHL